jgi:hypothetical protein
MNHREHKGAEDNKYETVGGYKYISDGPFLMPFSMSSVVNFFKQRW